MLKTVCLSILIVLLISFGLGFAAQNVIGFWQGVVLVTIAQFIGFYFYDPNKKSKVLEQGEELAFSELLSTQTVSVNCPCGQQSMMVPILLNSENIFVCEKCNSKFRVNPVFESVLLTEPLNIANAFAALKNKEQSYNSVNESV